MQTLDDGTEMDFTKLNFGDYVQPHALSAGRGHTLDSLVGSYEYRTTLTDRNGNGWEYSTAIEGVRHPTNILGDLNYNGYFDFQDYNILQQNVEVAPDEPHGEFLRRLDLNGDSLVNADDLSHFVSQLSRPVATYLTVGETYEQDFDALGSEGAVGSELPKGWFVADRFGTPAVRETNAAFPTSPRDLRAVDASHTLNVGLPEGEGASDRGLAIYNPRGSSERASIHLFADTATQAEALKVEFSMEAWDRIRTTSGNRDGGEAAFNVSVDIDRGEGNSDIGKIMGDFTELVSLGKVTTDADLPRPDGDYLDGNDPAHHITFASEVLHADIPAGARLRFRWETTGEADASEEWIFGIDDVSISLVAAGDADANREVNFFDFLALADNFGEAGGWEQGDFDGDGQVAFHDFLALAENFGQTTSEAATVVPEPTTALMAVFGFLGLIGFRKRR